jgi:hypothetical protein
MREKFPSDIAFREFASKIDSLKILIDGKNEAMTRLRAIDTILFEILLWDKKNVDVETYCRASGYADYVFLASGKPFLVLEAKKAGIDFLFEGKVYKDRPYQFGLLANECPSASSALQQAIGYAATLGARYVAISNGHQWLFTLSFVPDQPLENRLVYVFESFEGIRDKFSSFCKCFNKDEIFNNTISRELLDNLKLPAPAKLSSRIPGYPQVSSRNVYQNELSYILDYVWQVMSQSENSVTFVENCYVNPNSHHDILTLAKELISKRRQEDDIISKYTIETIDKLPHELANLPAEKPFVILGEVGRGKSSFLKYLRFVYARENFKNYIQIELNFLDRPDSPEEIHNFVYSEIERQLLENYRIDIHDDSFVRGVLHFDLKRLRNTPRGKLLLNEPEKYAKFEVENIETITLDKHTYLTKVFHHMKRGQQKSLALFFDNLDRRSRMIQEESFLKSSAIARDWACLVFICLRPTTYYKSQEKGVLDTIAPTTFTVGHPDLSLVLKRRFSYAKQISVGQSLDQSGLQSPPSRDLSFDLPSVAKIFESCEFAAWKRHGIIPTLEAVSNGNIRRLIDLTRRILCSGHLDTKKILDRIEENGKYYIPDFEGVKTLLFGDYMQYDSSKSPFINLFDIKHADSAEHFLAISILHYLSKIPDNKNFHTYTKVSDLIAFLALQGFSYGVSQDTIRSLIDKNYINLGIEKDSLDDSDIIKISTLGRYHIFNLVSEFQYLDATIIDTPILDEETRDEIIDVNNIHDRLKRTDLFLHYLNRSIVSINDGELKSLWEKIFVTSLKKIDEIKEMNKRYL